MSAPQKSSQSVRSPDEVMKDRFYSVIAQCMTRRTLVTVTNAAGEQFAGRLETLVKEGVSLEFCRKVGSEDVAGKAEFRDYQTIEFEIEDEYPQAKFKRDKEISKARAPGRRELQKYSPDTPVQHTLDDPSTLGKFDQFETNRKLFGVTATFREEQYTTPLVKPEELTTAQLRHTEKVIKALSRAQTLDDAGGEEEERFAAVQGTGRFKKTQDRASLPAMTNSSGELPVVRTEKQTVKRSLPQGFSKNYLQFRDDLVAGRRLRPGLVNSPESIEALQLEPATYRNENVADHLERFKKCRAQEAAYQRLQEFKELKKSRESGDSVKRPALDGASEVKEEQKEVPREVAEEVPASLLDMFLDCLSEQDGGFEPVDPYWPVPAEHRAATMPPIRDPSHLFNPDAPAFESAFTSVD